MPDRIDDKQWQRFLEEGYLLLGAVLDDAELNTLKTRIDDIMQGKVELPYDRMMMQLDGKSSCYREMEPMTKGHKGQTLNYRKITELELDPFFLAFMQKPLFRAICARAHGPSTPISTPRAMFMNKPAETGTHLPWHHDVFVNLDIDRSPHPMAAGSNDGGLIPLHLCDPRADLRLAGSCEDVTQRCRPEFGWLRLVSRHRRNRPRR